MNIHSNELNQIYGEKMQESDYCEMSVKELNKESVACVATLSECENNITCDKLDTETFDNEKLTNGLKEKYLSCDFLESGMVLESRGVNHCCGKISSEFDQNCIMEFNQTFDEDTDLFIEKFIEEKKKLIELNRAGKETMCTSCEYLKEGYWEKKKKINSINVSFDNSCNFRCVYCYKVRSGKSMTHMERSEEEILKKVLAVEKVDIDRQVIYSSGEISIQPNVNKILDLLQKYDLSIFTNASVYNERIHEIIKKKNCSMVVSVDSGTRETFKQIKGVDLFDRVWENIGKYASENGNVILKYILMGSNFDAENLNGFIEMCTKHGIKHIRISRNWHYDGDKIENGVFKASLHLIRKAQKAGIIVHNDGVTQI